MVEHAGVPAIGEVGRPRQPLEPIGDGCVATGELVLQLRELSSLLLAQPS